MTTDRTLLQQALEALTARRSTESEWRELITALRARLAEPPAVTLPPMPEPDGWALGEAYYPEKTTGIGAVRFGGRGLERYTADQMLDWSREVIAAMRAAGVEVAP